MSRSINNRLRELDFLRGIAIILVLFRHKYILSYLGKMGWIGVDLFFVLSGFLVSGLLFKEYRRYGSINIKLFLIRRGFKIYPLFYLTYILYFIFKLDKSQIDYFRMFSELFFFQNYTIGLGYAYVATWSLAIEEQFYFSFAFLLFIYYKFYKSVKLNYIIILALIVTLLLRIFYAYNDVDSMVLYTRTHLRIDSLLSGVLISYYYYFYRDKLYSFYSTTKKYLLFIVLLMISFVPFVDFTDSIWVRTFGFSILYIAFGLLLIQFLNDKDINIKLDKYFSKKIVDLISVIGFSSYAIYLIHILVLYLTNKLYYTTQIEYHVFVLIQYSLAISIGILITKYIESYFLMLRDIYFPKRVN